MKVKANKIHLILGIVALTQMGCNGTNQQRGQYLYPNVASQAQDLTTTGDVFRRTNPGSTGTQGNLSNLFNAAARGANNPDGQPVMTQAELEAAAMAKVKAEEAAKKKAAEDGVKSEEPSTFDVNRDDEDRAETGCKPDAENDTDGDGLSDACENASAYAGIDPTIYNGFAISAVTLNADQIPDASKVKDKDINLKKSSMGADFKFDRKVIKYYMEKVVEAKKAGKTVADLRALKELFNVGKIAKTFAHPDPSMFAKDIAKYADFPENIALANGIGATAAPFGLEAGAANLANLTGIESTSLNLTTNYGFMYVAETHVVLPSKSVNIQVAQLVNQDNAISGSKAGMFFVLGDGNTEILQSDMFEDKQDGTAMNDFKGVLKTKGTCQTTHLTIVFFADKKLEYNKNLFAENVVYKDGDGVWRTFSQDMLRLKPVGSKCTYNAENLFFGLPGMEQGVAALH
jgi:hypothetical protein